MKTSIWKCWNSLEFTLFHSISWNSQALDDKAENSEHEQRKTTAIFTVSSKSIRKKIIFHQYLMFHLRFFGKLFSKNFKKLFKNIFISKKLTTFSALYSFSLFQIVMEILRSSEVSSFCCALVKRQTYNDCYAQTFSLVYVSGDDKQQWQKCHIRLSLSRTLYGLMDAQSISF